MASESMGLSCVVAFVSLVLIRLISDIQRAEAAADASIVAGDKVRLMGDLPTRLAGYRGMAARL